MLQPNYGCHAMDCDDIVIRDFTFDFVTDTDPVCTREIGCDRTFLMVCAF